MPSTIAWHIRMQPGHSCPGRAIANGSRNVDGWSGLRKELDRWHAAGSTATFWWRDDDAVDDSPQLDVLLEHASGIPVALGVIPALATRELAEKLAKRASVVVLQHGWRHDNHALADKNEYPAARSTEEVSQELANGRRVLTALFGAQAIPVFAPPWHGFDARFLPLLRPNGLAGISRKGPRTSRFAAEGVLQANAHVAPIEWSAPPSFANDDLYLDQVVDHLRGRRLGTYDATEPTGLLTHHLAQNDESYGFIARLVAIISSHPGCSWMNAMNMFSRRSAGDDTAEEKVKIDVRR